MELMDSVSLLLFCLLLLVLILCLAEDSFGEVFGWGQRFA